MAHDGKKIHGTQRKTSHGTGRKDKSWHGKERRVMVFEGKKRKERRARQKELHIPGP